MRISPGFMDINREFEIELERMEGPAFYYFAGTGHASERKPYGRNVVFVCDSHREFG